MPQTTPERAGRWPGMDHQAMAYLEAQGYTLTRKWTWIRPHNDHIISPKEDDAILYLFEEWDFGGAEPREKVPRKRRSRAKVPK